MRQHRGLARFTIVLFLSAAAPVAHAHDINPPDAPHDHFQCYKSTSTGPLPATVQLTDTIESATYTVSKHAAICLPAEKNQEGPPDDPVTHLASYRIGLTKTSPAQPKHSRRIGISVENQFGVHLVDTVKVDRMLVPTAISTSGPVLAPDPSSHKVDRYKCYRVKPTKGLPPIPQPTVRVADAFEDRNYILTKPTRLCTAVRRNGEPQKNPYGHFLCYKTALAGGQASHTQRQGVNAANELGLETLATKKEDELCVPSVLYGVVPTCILDPTFETIQERIFSGHGCNVSTCHGPISPQGSLDLQAGASYLETVGVLAAHPVAAAAGKLLVDPGNAAGSFLSQKLRGTQAPTEGATMPLVGTPLSDTELDLVDAWIDAGASPTDVIPNPPCVPPLEFNEQSAPPVPPGGYQIVLNGPVLQPGQEQEGCLWVPTPNTVDFDVLRWEYVINPGTHHFAVFGYNHPGAPITGVWSANDFGCFSGAQFGNSISGSPQAPYYVDAYPAGVARRLTADGYLGLNAHYYNLFNQPIQMKVWINLYPYSGVPDHIAQTIIEIDETFTINVPPFTVGTHQGSWVNTSAAPWHVVSLSAHMHKRGIRFTEWLSDGTKIYENFDYAHPISRYFNPPLVLQPGEYIDYECEYDNGAINPAKLKRWSLGTPCQQSEIRCIGGPNHNQLCGGVDSLCDSAPGAGDGDCDACPIHFGVSAEDEMCILTGQFYPGP